MKYRQLGASETKISAIGFGCGSTAGTMISRWSRAHEALVQQALDSGICMFDTSPGYGHGASEENLGRYLGARRDEALVATKVQVESGKVGAERRAQVRRSVEGSLSRLKIDHLDLVQVHNKLTGNGVLPETAATHNGLSAKDVIDGGVLEELQAMRDEGMCRFIGFTGVGDPLAVGTLLGTRAFDTVQVYFNLLNPSAGVRAPAGFRYMNYGGVIELANQVGTHVLAIRTLAAGALTSSKLRSYPKDSWAGRALNDVRADHVRAQSLKFLEESCSSLELAALRFATGHEGVGTTILGISRPSDITAALQALDEGPLDAELVKRVEDSLVAD